MRDKIKFALFAFFLSWVIAFAVKATFDSFQISVCKDTTNDAR